MMPALAAPAARQGATGGPQRIRTALSLCAAIAVAQGILWLGRRSGTTPWWMTAIYPVFFFAAAARCFRTARQLNFHERRGWMYFTLGCLSFGAADLTWIIYQVYFDVYLPSPSLADLGYVAAPIFLILGIGYCRSQTRGTWLDRVQIGNLGIIASSILLSYTFLLQGFKQAQLPTLTAVFGVSYGILDLSLALFGFITVFSHLWGRQRLVMMLVLFALIANAAADLHYSYTLARGGYDPSHAVTVFYIAVAALFYWAASEREALGAGIDVIELTAEAEERAKQWETLFPSIAVAGVLVVAFIFREGLTSGMLPYFAAFSILFVISLTARNWWGHQMEVELRRKALSSTANLQAANDELQREMKTRVRVEEELRHSQKMDALGQLTGGVAHDFNNLLAVILGNLEIAEQSERIDSALREQLREAIEAADQGAALTQRLLTLSRKQLLRPQVIEVSALLQSMQNLLERSLGEQIRVDLSEVDSSLRCLADRAQLEGALLNLAINSRDAMPSGGTLSIRAYSVTLDGSCTTQHSDAQAEKYVAIAIRDTGIGIAPDIVDKVFEPFFTTKDVNEGTGLGLSMVYGFAEQSGGRVAIDSEVGGGTEVRIYLPISEVPPRKVECEEDVERYKGRGEVVLVVEDDVAVRTLVIRLVGGLGYTVIAAKNAEEALAALTSNERIDLLLSDVVLPGGTSGRDLAREVENRRPEARVLLMSGYAEKVLERGKPLEPDEQVLHKPFRKIELARRIRARLDA